MSNWKAYGMTFLNSIPDFSGTIFSDTDLHEARTYLVTGITDQDQAWLRRPQGILGEYWRRDDTLATCYLIDFARIVYRVYAKTGDRSRQRLDAKLRGMLRPPSAKQFDETYTEIQAASLLFERFQLVSFLEADDFIEPRVARAPDLSLHTGDEVIYAEVSVFHGGILDAWSQTVDHISAKVQEYAFKHRRMVDLRIRLSLELEASKEQIVQSVLSQMSLSDSGMVRIGKSGMIRWKPVPVVNDTDSDIEALLASEPSTRVAIVASPGATVDRAFSSQGDIALASEEDVRLAEELILKSLRNKLDEKRSQFLPTTEPEPCLLILRLGHHKLTKETIIAMLLERIWPNIQDYSWLSGLALFEPRQNYSVGDKPSNLLLCPNPNTIRPLSEPLLALFR